MYINLLEAIRQPTYEATNKGDTSESFNLSIFYDKSICVLRDIDGICTTRVTDKLRTYIGEYVPHQFCKEIPLILFILENR